MNYRLRDKTFNFNQMAQKRNKQSKKPKQTSKGVKKSSKQNKNSSKNNKYQQNVLLQSIDDYNTTQSVLRSAHNSGSKMSDISNSIQLLSMTKKQEN